MEPLQADPAQGAATRRLPTGHVPDGELLRLRFEAHDDLFARLVGVNVELIVGAGEEGAVVLPELHDNLDRRIGSAADLPRADPFRGDLTFTVPMLREGIAVHRVARSHGGADEDLPVDVIVAAAVGVGLGESLVQGNGDLPSGRRLGPNRKLRSAEDKRQKK